MKKVVAVFLFLVAGLLGFGSAAQADEDKFQYVTEIHVPNLWHRNVDGTSSFTNETFVFEHDGLQAGKITGAVDGQNVCGNAVKGVAKNTWRVNLTTCRGEPGVNELFSYVGRIVYDPVKDVYLSAPIKPRNNVVIYSDDTEVSVGLVRN